MTSSFNLRAGCNSLLSPKALLYQYFLSKVPRILSRPQYSRWLVKLSRHKSNHQRYFLRLINKKFRPLIFQETRSVSFLKFIIQMRELNKSNSYFNKWQIIAYKRKYITMNNLFTLQSIVFPLHWWLFVICKFHFLLPTPSFNPTALQLIDWRDILISFSCCGLCRQCRCIFFPSYSYRKSTKENRTDGNYFTCCAWIKLYVFLIIQFIIRNALQNGRNLK